MKTTNTELLADLRAHRGELHKLTQKASGAYSKLFDALVEFKKVHRAIDLADSVALGLAHTARDLHLRGIAFQSKRTDTPKPTAKHFKMLAILSHYGDMHKGHIALLLGVNLSTVDVYASTIRRSGINAGLKSRKGLYSLEYIGESVLSDNRFNRGV